MLSESIKDQLFKDFVSGSLRVGSVDPSTGAFTELPVLDVVQHHTPHKKMMTVWDVDGRSVRCTEDHSLFIVKEDGSLAPCTPKAASEIGQIAVVRDGSLLNSQVGSVSESGREMYTYDLSVPPTENFILASGIVAHNTYSISGVSLDIEKSSKYQGMAEVFEQGFEKLIEPLKRSVKFIKGLQQPRYGVGISSALGPFSRAGIQSRSNYVSGQASWS